MDADAGPRSGRIADAAIPGGIRVRPELLAGLLLKTEDSLNLFGLRHAVHDVDLSLGDRRTTVARADGHPPLGLKLVGGEFFDQARFTPDAIAVGAPPLGPVLGGGD